MKFGKLIGRAEELLPDLKHLCIRYKDLKKYLRKFRLGVAIVILWHLSTSWVSHDSSHPLNMDACADNDEDEDHSSPTKKVRCVQLAFMYCEFSTFGGPFSQLLSPGEVEYSVTVSSA